MPLLTCTFTIDTDAKPARTAFVTSMPLPMAQQVFQEIINEKNREDAMVVAKAQLEADVETKNTKKGGKPK